VLPSNAPPSIAYSRVCGTGGTWMYSMLTSTREQRTAQLWEHRHRHCCVGTVN
jgi:hypothetical protein